MAHAPNILIITTSADRMGADGTPTGLWLEELTTPYYAFADAGAHVTLASVAGGPIPIDERSLAEPGDNAPSVKRYREDEALQALVADSPRFDSIDASAFDAVFLPGGHGTMVDYPDTPALARLIERFERDGKVISAICHGPAALVGAKAADGSPFVQGRQLAAFTDSEERAAGLDKTVPFLLESRLKELGARHDAGPDYEEHVVRDRNLVTGQNPASAGKAAELVMAALRAEAA